MGATIEIAGVSATIKDGVWASPDDSVLMVVRTYSDAIRALSDDYIPNLDAYLASGVAAVGGGVVVKVGRTTAKPGVVY